MIDANLISHIYDHDAITVLKPFCKKKQLKIFSGEEHLNDISNPSTLSISIHNFCTSLYSLALNEAENTITQYQARFLPYKPTALSPIFDSSSPPPQI